MRLFFQVAAPCLATFWIAFAFISANTGLGIDYWRVLAYAAALSFVSGGLLVVSGWLYRPISHPSFAMAAAALIIAVFQYDQVGSLLGKADIMSAKPQMALWALGTVVFTAAIASIARYATGRLSLMIGLTAMLTAAVIQTAVLSSLSRSTPMQVDRTSAASPTSPGQSRDAATGGEIGQPVISLVLDTYSRSDVLAEMFGVKNDGFERALEERGFVIADQAMSNYPWTSLSMSSALDMNYIVEAGKERPYDDAWFAEVVNGMNETVAEFRRIGYDYALFHAGRYRTTINCSGLEDVCLQCGGRIDETELVLLEKTPLAHILRKVAPTLYVSLGGGDCPITELPEKMRRLGDKGFFLLGHHMSLHDAMNVDDKCQPLDAPVPATWPSTEFKEAMQWQVACQNRQVLAAVDGMLAAYADPIILISGDHGFWSDGYDALDTAALFRRHAIFTAIRLPQTCRNSTPQDLTPVNHYRLILACLSGREPDLLPNRFFAIKDLGTGNAGRAIRVTEIDPDFAER